MTELPAPYILPPPELAAPPAWSADLDLEDLALGDLADLGLPDLADLTAADFTDQAPVESQRYRIPPRPKFLHPRQITYEHAQQAAADLWPLAPGERVHALVNGGFIFGDLIEAAAVQHNWLIQELWIATLTLNQANIESLANLYAGDYLRHLHLLVSDYWVGHEKAPDGLLRYAWDTLDQEAPERSFQLASIYHHAKITLIATADGARYVLHGSANLRSTAMVEVFAVEHDAVLFDWHRAWMQGIEQQYATINHDKPHPASRRSTPRRPAWQQILDNTAAPTTPVNAPPTRK